MQQLSEAQLEQLFELYDIDHDKLIQWNEFICCIVIIYSGGVEEKLKLIFNAFDKNLDEKISKKEFSLAVEKFSIPTNFTKENKKGFIDKVFRECDTDGNGFLSLNEFITWSKKDPQTFRTIAGLLATDI
eukprot:TRINITY_DN1929_c0_g2_i5.p1 TRINITY_DN1929_c0_g2~~TRINITY_DN1929_c0_g2_i5.p1  ORF type:complete len:130 (-),score=35.31 TRINITY_DN1929_c0_g2_i5:185-574(-)